MLVEKLVWVQCQICPQKYVERKNKKYCSSACRWNAWYKKRYDSKTSPCVYCGMPGTTVDHVPPQSVRPFLEEVQERRFLFLEVPACRECNSALGAKTLWTIKARKDYMKRWIERRYAYDLAMPAWSKEEIREMGESLQLDIVAGLARRDLTIRRLKW